MTLAIAPEKMVRFSYSMTTTAGDLIEASEEPLTYLHGYTAIMPGLQAALVGRCAGERFQVDLPPEQAFGERRGPGPSPVPRAAFPPEADLAEGMAFSAQGPDGIPVRLFIVRLEEEQVWVDQEHPLVGQTLRFEVEVHDVRDATAEELAAMTSGCCSGGGCGSHDHGEAEEEHECCGGGHCKDKEGRDEDSGCCGGEHCA